MPHELRVSQRGQQAWLVGSYVPLQPSWYSGRSHLLLRNADHYRAFRCLAQPAGRQRQKRG